MEWCVAHVSDAVLCSIRVIFGIICPLIFILKQSLVVLISLHRRAISFVHHNLQLAQICAIG